MASTTPRARTWCWCGAGWARVRSRPPVTRCIRTVTNFHSYSGDAPKGAIMHPWEDPRVIRGMRSQLEQRRARLAAGDTALGWKVGFGAPAMQKVLQVSGPLVGFLTANGRVQSGEGVSLTGWTKPVAEPEIAVHIGADVPAGA